MNTDNTEIDPNDSSRNAFVRPAVQFKGKNLHPYTLGIKILWFQIVDLKTEHYTWLVLSLMYLLTIDRKEAQRLAFDKEAFRTACLEWVDTLEEQDIVKAAEVFEELTNRTEAARVEPVDDSTGDSKKA